ncbi:hypothetical protein PGT21_033374 [Puccinia graminis f. sp. tritici]|nr:hypothetical protein PGT21_033374 [Puccinia graminis f. sp. tritici]
MGLTQITSNPNRPLFSEEALPHLRTTSDISRFPGPPPTLRHRTRGGSVTGLMLGSQAGLAPVICWFQDQT